MREDAENLHPSDCPSQEGAEFGLSFPAIKVEAEDCDSAGLQISEPWTVGPNTPVKEEYISVKPESHDNANTLNEPESESDFPRSRSKSPISDEISFGLRLCPREILPKTGGRYKFLCQYCRHVGPRTQQAAHRRSHNDDVSRGRPYTCLYCPGTFGSGQERRVHEDLHTRPLAPFPCSKCGDRFYGKVQLRSHKEECDYREHFTSPEGTQSKDRRGTCLHCGKVVLVPAQRAHVLMHMHMAKPKPPRPPPPIPLLPCVDCGQEWASYASLRQHRTQAHGTAEEELSRDGGLPLQCKICLASFPVLRALDAHAKIHGYPFQCSVCKNMFRTEYYLDMHMIVHGGPIGPRKEGSDVEAETNNGE
jgi:hypothetical protein